MTKRAPGSGSIPPEDYDSYVDKLCELVWKRKHIPKDFSKRHSPWRHRPTSDDWLAEMGELARLRFLESKRIKEIVPYPTTVTLEGRWSAFNKELRRYEQKVFRRCFYEYMQIRGRRRSVSHVRALPSFDPSQLQARPPARIQSVSLERAFVRLRRSLSLPVCLHDGDARELLRRLNYDYICRRHKAGKQDRDVAQFYPDFAAFFCKPQA